MQYCKYHPLQAATYHCSNCSINCCDQCIDLDRGNDPHCYHCQQSLDSLGSSNSATPFWRRLPESFRYPLNTETGVLLLLVSFLSAVLIYVPLGILWVLMLTGTFFKYSMSCLEKTAQGEMDPPDITSAYGGGLTLLLQLVLIVTVMGATVSAAYIYLGSAFGGLLGTFMVIALPAVIINFAITENVWQALNPSDAIRIIKTVGLPYGILMAFILIMISSVSVFSNLLGGESSIWLGIIQSMISNYYTLVVFHIMGYMIFQYQREFGFYARHSNAANLSIPSDRERLSSKIDITLKEGQFDEVLNLYSKGLKQYPDDAELYISGFNFICGIKDKENIGIFTDRYLLHLKSINRLDKVRTVHARACQIDQDYKPAEALQRHLIAQACFDCGDFNKAVKLLNGLHRQHPDYFDLANAYTLMSKALEQLPNMQENADKYRRLAQKIKTQPKPKSSSGSNKFLDNTNKPIKTIKNPNEDKEPETLEPTEADIKAERRAQARILAAERIKNEDNQDLGQIGMLANEATTKAKPSLRKHQKPPEKSQSLQDIFDSRKVIANSVNEKKPDDSSALAEDTLQIDEEPKYKDFPPH